MLEQVFDNLQGGLSPIDLISHIGNSLFALPQTFLNTELCDCLFGIQGHHISGFFCIVTETFRNIYDQSAPQK